MIQKVLKEFYNLSVQHRLFILSAMLCGFLISADYAIIRPVSNSVFITTYSSSMFPYAWLATVPLNLLVVSLYNKYLPKIGSLKMCLSIVFFIMLGNVFCALFLKEIPVLAFFFYIWKEVYILLMLQQVWSIIHSTITFSQAKYLYGILFGVGALGSICGSTLPGFFAVKIGSETLLFATPIIYTLFIAAFTLLLHFSKEGIEAATTQTPKKSPLATLKEGFDLIRKSPYLPFIMAIVALMQIASSLIDFQFNHFLEGSISSKDLRTEYTAKVLGIVHLSTLILQFVGSFLLIHFLGFKKSHLFVPMILCINAVGVLFFPVFAMISLSFITIKCFDFSLFLVIKEMLYVPLKKEEKFQAKALIDVFGHRSSKAIASFLILGTQLAAGVNAQLILSWAAIAIFLLWCLTVVWMFKAYKPEQLKV